MSWNEKPSKPRNGSLEGTLMESTITLYIVARSSILLNTNLQIKCLVQKRWRLFPTTARMKVPRFFSQALCIGDPKVFSRIVCFDINASWNDDDDHPMTYGYCRLPLLACIDSHGCIAYTSTSTIPLVGRRKNPAGHWYPSIARGIRRKILGMHCRNVLMQTRKESQCIIAVAVMHSWNCQNSSDDAFRIASVADGRAAFVR